PFASKLFNTEGLGKPIIRIRDLKEQTFVTYTTEDHPKGHLIQPGDIVVGMDGEFRPYLWGNEEAWLNQRVCIFENKRLNGKAFLLYTIKPLLNVIEQTQVATTVIHIGKKDFDAFEIFLPDDDSLNRFDEITTPMVEQIVNNRLENKRLSNLRDVLLPKLMSGEINVSEIDL
ncbi:MAG: restriction endonuclease subunit S, partial [Clostridia bacterium]|nr:restriction endonuclease subunit S [Clostridia bacterium]